MAQRREQRLTLVCAAAGYGKTTALRRMFPGPEVRWHRGGDVAQLVAGGLAELASTAEQLVIDDLPPLSQRQAQELLVAAAGLPHRVSLALASRWPVVSAAPAGLPGPAPAQLHPGDLGLSPEQVEQLLDREYGLTEPGLAARVRELTAGWPMLVRLVAEMLRSGGLPAGPLLPAVTEPGGPLANYLRDEVLSPLPAPQRRLLSELAGLAPVTAGLAAAVGHSRAAAAVPLLAGAGLLTTVGADPDCRPRIVPVVAAVVGYGQSPIPAATLATAAGWYERHGPPRAAARAWQLAGEPERCAQVLAAHGDRMIVTGQPAPVAALIAALPPALRTRQLRLLAGDALRTGGEVAAAAAAYQQVAAADPDWDAGVAWRMGLVSYLRGDQPTALAHFARGRASGPATDRALLLAWTAAATSRLGDAAGGLAHAHRAYQLAIEAGEDTVLATAHISLGLCLGLTGDQLGSEEHYQQALQAAQRAGDLVLLARLLANRSYHLMAQASYAAAQAAAAAAARYAAAAGHANLLALATGNEAHALSMLGRYDEAVARYTRVLTQHRQMGSGRSAAALIGLGEVHRLRGSREQARASFQEASQLAEAGGSRELLVKALAGLARVLLPDDPAAAACYAEQAVAQATGEIGPEVRAPALLAQGWVAVVNGAREQAQQLATEVVGCARDTGNRSGLAEALELRAATEIDPERVRAALREAHSIWSDAGAVAGAARTLLGLSQLPGATADDRLAALLAAQRLAADGIPPLPPAVAGSVAVSVPGPGRAGVVLKTLGRFEVRVGGCPVPATAWQSRRARDLLRILVSRRGRPVPRGELCELLWPDDDPSRTGHRLSVLLSIVRGVLDPDRALRPDYYLVADPASVALDVTHLRVDVTEFLAAIGHGRRLLERGAIREAATVLSAAVSDYRAEVFADEPYDDWSQPVREQARAAYLAGLRMLAQSHLAAKATGLAVECLLRLLEHDPYDEPAHRSLVRALVAGGQHGEARRALARYRDAMTAIGVHPPDDRLLAPRPAPTRGRGLTGASSHSVGAQ